MFVVVAAFEVNPADRERFLAVAHQDASRSVEREPGCRQFDVCVHPEREGLILFYEVYGVYDDAAAFEEHKRTDHSKTFDEGSRPLIVRSDVRFLDRICPRRAVTQAVTWDCCFRHSGAWSQCRSSPEEIHHASPDTGTATRETF